MHKILLASHHFFRNNAFRGERQTSSPALQDLSPPPSSFGGFSAAAKAALFFAQVSDLTGLPARR
jgi:hypothetical protein